ncbi:hypothetical protein AMECASPLE_028464 [Ameca splendens]|uniref:Uncharacterized protein n=1 Tax=Ameca splendens TaxID=208324 RepID=A0ABV1A198_9TELE
MCGGGGSECHASLINSKTVNLSVQNGENMRNHCSRLNQHGGNSSPWKLYLREFSPARCRCGLRLVYESSDLLASDRIPAFKLFREWPCGASPDMRLRCIVPGDTLEMATRVGFLWLL